MTGFSKPKKNCLHLFTEVQECFKYVPPLYIKYFICLPSKTGYKHAEMFWCKPHAPLGSFHVTFHQ